MAKPLVAVAGRPNVGNAKKIVAIVSRTKEGY